MTKKHEKITLRMLKRYGACESQQEIFSKLWPTGVVPSLAAVRKAFEAGPEVGWLTRLLSAKAWDAFYSRSQPGKLAFRASAAAAHAAYQAVADSRPALEVLIKAMDARVAAIALARRANMLADAEAMWYAIRKTGKGWRSDV